MSWRAVVSSTTQTSRPPRGPPPPSFYSPSALWCWFLVLFKKVVSICSRKLEFYQDPRVVSENVLQKHCPLKLYWTVQEALSCGLEDGKVPKRSSRSMSLNSNAQLAKWRFEVYEHANIVPVSLLTLANESEEQFDSWGEPCNVPMNWQMPANQTKKSAEKDLPIYTNIAYPFPHRFTNLSTYISERDNPTCVYRARFQLPQQWCEDTMESEHDLILILHGAGPGVEVFANGNRLGYHTDSLTEHEYLLTPECVPRDARKLQVITLRIFKYCAGSYLEDQDQWWLTGIHRDVELQFRPRAACVWDMDVRASFAAARVEINCAVSLDDTTHEQTPFMLRASLYESPSVVMETVVLPIRVIPRGPDDPTRTEQLYLGPDRRRAVAEGSMFVLPKERIEPWTAETPRLYTLILELVQVSNESEPSETVVQVEVIRIGFRDLRLNPERAGQFEVNGQRVVFRGTNRHEFSPHQGKCLSDESMVTDILQMKRHNINAVRNSHYPNNQRWYDLCDYYGLYVIDESNIECHGFLLGGAISLIQFDSAFRDGFLSRSYAMVLRARNHPSIVCWSLGNESGYGPNAYECSKLIRILDDERPVVYEGGVLHGVPLILGDGRNPVSDFIFPMYHTPSLIESYEVESRARGAPVVLCEYGHCMGNSGGGLHLYWHLFWKENSIWQGGFLWDWVDQGIAHSQAMGGGLPSERSFYGGNGGNSSSHHNLNVGFATSSPGVSLLQSSSTASRYNGDRADSSGSIPMAASGGKVRRSSSVSMYSPHRDNELCVSRERLMDISFQGRGWAYGGDFGEKSGKQDAQFCLNGLVFPDRSPKPALIEAKYLMQPYQIILEGVTNGNVVDLTVKRRCEVGDLMQVFEWALMAGDSPQVLAQGRVDFVGDVTNGLRQSARVVLNFNEVPTTPSLISTGSSNPIISTEGQITYLRVSVKALAGSSPSARWIVGESHHEIAYEVFELVRLSATTFGRALPPSPAHIASPLNKLISMESPQISSIKMNIVDGTHQLVIHGDNYDARLDMKSGALTSFRGKDGHERLAGPSFVPCLYRACTDNDLGGVETHVLNPLARKLFLKQSMWSYAGRWRTIGLNEYDETKRWNRIEVFEEKDSSVRIIRQDRLFLVETVLTFLELGVRANISVEWKGGAVVGLDSLPRIGTFMEFASHYSRVTYCGRGIGESYPDRKSANKLGVYSELVDDFYVPYVFPSECGGRADVRWMVMEDVLNSNNNSSNNVEQTLNVPSGFALSYSCLDEPEWAPQDEFILGDGPRFKRPVGTRGAQVSISRFRTAQLDKARHQYELARDVNEWRAQSIKVVMDTAHMGVGGDVSWLPSVHDPFKIRFHDRVAGASKWTYQIDLDIIARSSDDDVERRSGQ